VNAGGSAAREAAAIRARARRGPWRRVSAWVGMNPEAVRADAVAARWERGAAAERDTARLLRWLRWRGWRVLHDRGLPGHGRANLDHVAVSPDGENVVVFDTKGWRRSWPTRVVAGRLHCGGEDRHGEAEKVARYAGTVARLLGVPEGAVWPVLVIHGSPVAGGRVQVGVAGRSGPVHILAAEELVPVLKAAPAGRNRAAKKALAARVDQVLRPYREGR